MKTVRLIVRGRVQGVFFRAYTKETADRLGISGWVKNLPDKSVEITATGNQESLQQFISWCRLGPTKARVDELKIEETAPDAFPDFRIIR
jgi:acylphosphatase